MGSLAGGSLVASARSPKYECIRLSDVLLSFAIKVLPHLDVLSIHLLFVEFPAPSRLGPHSISNRLASANWLCGWSTRYASRCALSSAE